MSEILNNMCYVVIFNNIARPHADTVQNVQIHQQYRASGENTRTNYEPTDTHTQSIGQQAA